MVRHSTLDIIVTLQQTVGTATETRQEVVIVGRFKTFPLYPYGRDPTIRTKPLSTAVVTATREMSIDHVDGGREREDDKIGDYDTDLVLRVDHH